jgi:hypothetical protein
MQQVFERVAKYSYNSCEFYNEIPKNDFFMIFYQKVELFPKTLRERGYMYHTRMTPLQTNHTYVDPVATRLVPKYFRSHCNTLKMSELFNSKRKKILLLS